MPRSPRAAKRSGSPTTGSLQTSSRASRPQHGIAALWDAHSIRSVLPRFFEGKLPDLNLGTANGASCDPALAQALLGIAKDAHRATPACSTAASRAATSRASTASPAQGVHAVQLEMTQCSYMQEALPFDYLPDVAARVQPHVRRMLEAVLDFVEAQLSDSQARTGARQAALSTIGA